MTQHRELKDKSKKLARPEPASDRGAVPEDSSCAARDDKQVDAGKPVEVGGPKGLEPTRYGDWEANGRCYDF